MTVGTDAVARAMAEQDHQADDWPALDGAALHGLAGDVVRTIAPHTEADPVALLVTYLAAFGAAVGRGPHARVGATEHAARSFVVLVGNSAKARKGTSWQEVRRVMAVADLDFVAERVLGGFGSGEAVVDAVAGGEDRRLFVLEPEFARLLAVGKRDGATISPLLRQAWDGDRLAVRSRAKVAVADGAHVALLGHITVEELRAKLTETETANGYANRHLFALARRSHLLPSGGNLDDAEVTRLGQETGDALRHARTVGIMHRTPDAEARWEELYGLMAADEPGGLLGTVIARDAAQVLRLSVIYALLDGAHRIDVPHSEAAWAVWRYCRESAEMIFGDRIGDEVADRLLAAVRSAGTEGLSRDEQHAALGRHISAARLSVARDLLVGRGLAEVGQVTTGGRPAEVLRACERSERGERSTPGPSLSSHLSLSSQSRGGQEYLAPPHTDDDYAHQGANDPVAERLAEFDAALVCARCLLPEADCQCPTQKATK